MSRVSELRHLLADLEACDKVEYLGGRLHARAENAGGLLRAENLASARGRIRELLELEERRIVRELNHNEGRGRHG